MMVNKYKIDIIFNKKNETLLLILLLLISYLLKTINTEYIFDGTDIPFHVLSGLRLHHTNLLDFEFLGNNFFAQLVQNSHGYTMQFLTWLVYEIFFNFFNISINESNILKVHSLFSVFTLIPIYLFFRKHLGFKKSLLVILIISLIPGHIGYSRSATGPLNISNCFLFLSLYFLDNLLSNYNSKNLLKYSLSLTFYIGSSNLFILGFFFNFFYIFLLSEKINIRVIKNTFTKIYFNFYGLLFIILPITVYIFVTIFSVFNQIENGYILRIFGKSDSLFFDYKKLIYLIIYIGPILLLFIFCFIYFFKNNGLKKVNLFFITYFIIFFTLTTISDADPGYYLFLIIPITYFILKNLNIKHLFLISFFLILNFFYTISFIYGYPYAFTNKNSSNRTIVGAYSPNNNYDQGQKTFAYLVRSKIFDVKEFKIDNNFFGELEYYNIITDIDGMDYYLNKKYIHIKSKIFESKLDLIDEETLVLLRNNKNKTLSNIIDKNNLQKILKICSKDKEILEVYAKSFVSKKKLKCFDTEFFNKKFTKTYKTFNDFNKTYIGQF